MVAKKRRKKEMIKGHRKPTTLAVGVVRKVQLKK